MNGTPVARYSRLNEAVGLLCLLVGLALLLSLVSYFPEDSSWNTAAGALHARNLIGKSGAFVADLTFQFLGLLAFSIPAIVVWIAWNRVRRRPVEAPAAKGVGIALLVFGAAAALSLGPHWTLLGGAVAPGGLAGLLFADALLAGFNLTGAILATCACLLAGLYLTTKFRLSHAAFVLGIPGRVIRPLRGLWRPRARRQAEAPAERSTVAEAEEPEVEEEPPFEPDAEAEPEPEPDGEIPIRTIEDLPPSPRPAAEPVFVEPLREEPAKPRPHSAERPAPAKKQYELPSTDLLNEPSARNSFDEEELKQIAARIKSKFEEFNVFGSVVQINPGPVVTTFEFKPEAGIKYNRITALNEDLCLGLQAESILIERIPGKPTVGIEVPNARREVIALRQILESDEFAGSQSRLTIPLGKDISGRIKVTPLEVMPHLLIAGSTGSGKSVMLNTLIMSALYKATPDDVRMILVDPKRLELGLYEGIPHLLTPVITDAKKATNALRNAVLEMERRLRLLAAQGVRNIEQYNRKVRQLRNEPIPLFEDSIESAEELEELPYILILIDELADLMMVEGHNVEQSVTRLAQMARAVGMHLVLATQRPSVDVITGLIKANFPARISFRVATRVDSRTVLDVMGAEHLLGKGDMLHLPPGSSRLIRMHAAFVTETEINRVVDFWRAQATPDYDQSFLIAPPEEAEGQDGAPADEIPGEEDPLYHDAVRVVIEMGKASTSTLQRRLRLGYGRAARILDMMQSDGIIGPPDGSKPREVLKRPDWLDEVGEEDER
jgi:S-DNA-T family DNA segregation ATPase FtsK/SpoIIIE